jgi:uncharacterized membrane protein
VAGGDVQNISVPYLFFCLFRLGEKLMKKLHFPEPFVHKHAPLRNVNEIIDERLTFAQSMADRVARIVGSWKFIIIQSSILALWAVLNVVAWTRHWDPYPFILMNLFLSLQAAYTAPIIMMSQNRLAVRDRIEAHQDFLVNQKAEEEIRAILDHLAAQDNALGVIHGILDGLVASPNTPGKMEDHVDKHDTD